jgi:hypothetical protein
MWFPRLSGGAIDGEIGIGVDLAHGIRARLALELCRYYFAMHPEPGDAWIAGGAVDQYFTTTLGVIGKWGSR